MAIDAPTRGPVAARAASRRKGRSARPGRQRGLLNFRFGQRRSCRPSTSQAGPKVTFKNEGGRQPRRPPPCTRSRGLALDLAGRITRCARVSRDRSVSMHLMAGRITGSTMSTGDRAAGPERIPGRKTGRPTTKSASTCVSNGRHGGQRGSNYQHFFHLSHP